MPVMHTLTVRTVHARTGEELSPPVQTQHAARTTLQVTTPVFNTVREAGVWPRYVVINGQRSLLNMPYANRNFYNMDITINRDTVITFEYVNSYMVTERFINVTTGMLTRPDANWPFPEGTRFRVNEPNVPGYTNVGTFVNGEPISLDSNGVGFIYITGHVTITYERMTAPPSRVVDVYLSGSANGSGQDIFRNSDLSLTVRGRALLANGNPAANVSLIVGVFNPSAPAGTTNRRESVAVRTDSNGDFITGFIPNVSGSAPSSFDRGTIYIRLASAPQTSWIWSAPVNIHFGVRP